MNKNSMYVCALIFKLIRNEDKIFVYCLCVGLFSCQSNDFAEDTNLSKQQDLKKNKEGLINGRYHFSSAESLSKTFDKMRQDEYFLEKTMKNLYLDGFRSMSPIGNIENDQDLARIFRKEMSEENLDEDLEENDGEETLIADPILSSFVNSENEIVVNDTLYKFTNKGIYFSYIKDSLNLFSCVRTVENGKISDEEILRLRETNSGKTLVAKGVYRFIAPLNEEERRQIEKVKQDMTKRTSPEQIQDIVSSLPITGGDRNWILHSIWGNSRVSVQHFDRRHRVKVEFWNQSYVFYKSIGISVRNQTRRLRIWWASKADEVAMGLNMAHLKYNMPTPPAPAPLNLELNSNQAQGLKYFFSGDL